MAEKAGRGSDQFALRFPPGLRDALRTLADQHGRSMNSELLHALEGYLQQNERAAQGWTMVPPEYVIGDDYKTMLTTISEETGWPVKDVLHEAIRRYLRITLTDKDEREKWLRDLTSEIVELVRHDLERSKDN